MVARPLVAILVLAAAVAVAVVFGPALLGPSPSPGGSGPLGLPSPSSPSATSARPSASASLAPTPTATPTRNPTASCAPVPAGGKAGGFHALTDVRVAHQPGFDRVVFDLGQESSAQDELPAYRIERASSFTNVAGQPVAVAGNVYWSVRFDGASTVRDGKPVYQGPSDIDPTTPLVRDVKLVEDFESVMIWAIGLEHLECPRVTTLRSPLRLVIDLPSPP